MGKIDTHCHLYPQEYWKELLKISERNSLPVDVQRIVTYYSKKGVPCRCALEVAVPNTWSSALTSRFNRWRASA